MAQIAAEIADYIVGQCSTLERPTTVGAVRSAINQYVLELLKDKWSFMESEGSTTGTLNTSDYTLTGFADVKTLKYDGTDFSRLYVDPEMFVREVNEEYKANVAPTIWTQKSRSAKGEAIITLFGIKDIAGKTIKYWARKIIDANDPLTLMPPDMRSIVETRMMMKFAPSSYVQYLNRDMNKEAIAAARRSYIPQQDLPRPLPMTPEMMRENFAKNRSFMGNAPYSAGVMHQYDNDGNFIR